MVESSLCARCYSRLRFRKISLVSRRQRYYVCLKLSSQLMIFCRIQNTMHFSRMHCTTFVSLLAHLIVISLDQSSQTALVRPHRKKIFDNNAIDIWLLASLQASQEQFLSSLTQYRARYTHRMSLVTQALTNGSSNRTPMASASNIVIATAKAQIQALRETSQSRQSTFNDICHSTQHSLVFDSYESNSDSNNSQNTEARKRTDGINRACTL